MAGIVYLVGAGPGDPKLITVRGQDCLHQAEVVVADRLVARELYERLADHVEVIVRGERRGGPSQDEINCLLVERARAGKTVVRLKGGDPFVFGRGGEEAEALAAAGVTYEVVPGVTAAVAAPAYAGIPLTHREVGGAVAFVTGHEADDKSAGAVDWDALARAAPTLVIYMSVSRIDAIARRLVAAGRAPSTPVAVIERGTRWNQRVVTGTLDDVAARVHDAGVQPPALTVVGEVVRLREKLDWFSSRPLVGRTVLCLGTVEGPSASPADPLGETALQGARVEWESPFSVESRPEALAESIARIDRYRWIALTSRHAVFALDGALGAAKLDGRALAGVWIAALARAAEHLESALRLRADVTASRGGTELGQAMLARDARGPVLFPRGADGRNELPELLRAAGVEVDVVTAYETVPASGRMRMLAERHRDLRYDAVAFGSPRGVAALLDAGFDPAGALVGAIGDTTATALTARGLTVEVVASRPRYETLLAELGAALAHRLKMG